MGDGHTRLWNSGRKCRLDRAPIFLFLLVFALLLASSPSFWVTSPSLGPLGVPLRSLSAASDAAIPLASRHEFLGPDPRVVGYYVDADGDYHIRWFDTFLQDQWIDNRKWKFDVRQDENGHWVDADD